MDKTDQPKESKRAVIEYRTKPLEEDAKWSLWFQREIESAVDSADAMKQFYSRPLWPAMTGAIEVKRVAWPD
jgi:hypothetical protein